MNVTASSRVANKNQLRAPYSRRTSLKTSSGVFVANLLLAALEPATLFDPSALGVLTTVVLTLITSLRGRSMMPMDEAPTPDQRSVSGVRLDLTKKLAGV